MYLSLFNYNKKLTQVKKQAAKTIKFFILLLKDHTMVILFWLNFRLAINKFFKIKHTNGLK